MGNSRYCRHCDGADHERVKDGLIRCVRKHKFVDPLGSCPDFDGGCKVLSMEELRESLQEEYLRKLRCGNGKL